MASAIVNYVCQMAKSCSFASRGVSLQRPGLTDENFCPDLTSQFCFSDFLYRVGEASVARTSCLTLSTPTYKLKNCCMERKATVPFITKTALNRYSTRVVELLKLDLALGGRLNIEANFQPQIKPLRHKLQ